MHFILCKDDRWKKTLQKEIGADFTNNFTPVSDVPVIKINDETDLRGSFIAFSTTALVNAMEIEIDSISKQVREISRFINEKISKNCTINLHVYGIGEKYGVIETGRAEIFKEKTSTELRKNKIKYLKKGFDRTIGFLQVLILPDRSVVVSFVSPNDMNDYHSIISPFIGGFNNVEDDLKAPSRAFKKIVEAQSILGQYISPKETLVDLGACPGGWTYIARNGGAQVIAIDRSPLAEELMLDELVQFQKTDAFKYQPKKEIDWVVSDIICAPERILELMDYWVSGDKCKYFVFTIKFQGSSEYGLLKKFKNFSKESHFKIILKQLNANKNEVTIMGQSC